MKKIIFLLLLSGVLFQSYANRIHLQIRKLFIEHKVADPRRAEVLLLGSAGIQPNSGKYAPWLATALFKAGINVTYTIDTNDLNAENLNKYDGLIIFAKYETISAAKEKSLNDFVEGGKGLVALHDAPGDARCNRVFHL
jgi:uncharacterized protein